MQNKETHAQLIIGKTTTAREKKIKDITGLKELKNRPDVHILKLEEDESSIGIDTIRVLIHKLSRKPHQRKKKIAVIWEAQFLTEEAQNALLKTLEEPPGKTQIVIAVNSTRNLLPTIISRCEIVRLRGKSEEGVNVPKEIKDEFHNLLQKDYGQRMNWSEKEKERLKNSQEVIKLLSNWLLILRSGLFEEKTTKKHLEDGLKYLNLLQKTNISPRLTIETFLLSLPVKKVGVNNASGKQITPTFSK